MSRNVRFEGKYNRLKDFSLRFAMLLDTDSILSSQNGKFIFVGRELEAQHRDRGWIKTTSWWVCQRGRFHNTL
jgi:hypothetical protein